jgi:Ran GTPase-activating protein (RanGAP) involved in mRNA processing and transport
MPVIIQQALIDKNCKGLYLAGNNLTHQGISILTDALYNNRTLIELDLADNSLSDQSIKILMNILLTNTTILEKLHLGYNSITDEGIEYIAESLKTNHSLTHLMLNHNHISNRGVHLLSSVLASHNISLEILSLSSNILITDTSIDSLIIMLKHNEILKTLDIKNCNISPTSCARLQQLTNQRKDFKLFFNTAESSCILS